MSPVIGTTAFDTAGAAMQLVRSLVNDADLVATSTIPPTGAVRALNQVTITTNAPHLLQIGSIVQVASVSNTSFNGTQTVFSVPSSTTFIYNQIAPDANSGNGVVQLLIQGDWATDNVLIPLVNKGYRKVQSRLLENGSPTATDELTVNLAAGAIQLNDSTAPQLPVEFLAPRVLKERITGQPFFGPAMTRVDQLPSCPQSPLNNVYAWFADGINFVGATNPTDLWIRYFVGQPYLANADSVMLIRGCLDAVASYAAFLATNARGSTQAGTFATLFEQEIKEFLNAQAHARQYKPSRRQPNNAGRRGRYSGYGNGFL